MVTECPICKLPRFHGVADYAQEMGENTKGSYPAIYMWR